MTAADLNQIPRAVREAVEACEERPTAVMICITCVDALLGTDMERVCRRASEYAGVPVLPCYMYALTREGRVPPMTSVRKTVYQLLEKRRGKKIRSTCWRILPVPGFLRTVCDPEKIRDPKVNEISRCADFEEYQSMSEANFNIVLNPESRLAAEDFKKRWNSVPGNDESISDRQDPQTV